MKRVMSCWGVSFWLVFTLIYLFISWGLHGVRVRSKDNLQKPILSFFHVGPGERILVIEFGSRCLSTLSHTGHAGPMWVLLFVCLFGTLVTTVVGGMCVRLESHKSGS